MKQQLIINKAQRLGNQKIEDVEIKIEGVLPETSGLDELGNVFDLDARLLADTLTQTLPQGTLVRLTALLLVHEAERNYLRVRY